MEKALILIAEKFGCTFSLVEGNVNREFEIRNVPKTTFCLELITTKFKLEATCQYLWGTSMKPSYFAGNSPDQYTCQIKLTSTQIISIPNFYIQEYSPVAKLFYGMRYRISCKDKLFTTYLKKNKILKTIYLTSENSAEFKPVFHSKTIKGNFTLQIDYQTFEILPEMFEKCIEFSLDLVKDK